MRLTLLLLAMLCAPVAAAEWRSDDLCGLGELPSNVRLQLQRGTVRCIEAEGRPALRFQADAKTSTVGKAALIIPFDPQRSGRRVTVSVDVYLPPETPANSIVMIDIECKNCGLPGNPGLRLYLRDGGLRIDRKKIGERHAWAVPDPQILPHAEWVRVGWVLFLGSDDSGSSIVTLNGKMVLANSGRTLPSTDPESAVDRVQIGVTANSNPVPVVLLMRDIRISID